MTVTTTRSRQHAGAPRSTGGQYAEESKEETAGTLMDTPPWKRRYPTAEAKVQAIREHLNGYVEELTADQELWDGFIDRVLRYRRLSALNQMLVHLQNPDAAHVGDYAYFAQQGLTPKEGTTGITVIAPTVKKVPRVDGNGHPVRRDDGRPLMDQVVDSFKVKTVFDVSQMNSPGTMEPQRLTTPIVTSVFAEDLAAVTGHPPVPHGEAGRQLALDELRNVVIDKSVELRIEDLEPAAVEAATSILARANGLSSHPIDGRPRAGRGKATARQVVALVNETLDSYAWRDAH